MPNVLNIIFSGISAAGTLAIFVHIRLIFLQRKTELYINTIRRIEKIAETTLQFYKDTADIQPYNVEDPEIKKWYMETVEPYLDFLTITSLEIEKKIIAPNLIKTYKPVLQENYSRIKEYIEFEKKCSGNSEDWSEIDTLNKRLGIT